MKDKEISKPIENIPGQIEITEYIEIPKKPIKKPILLRKFHDLRCSVCKGYIETEVDEYNYCPTCGQRIDWSEENE